VIIAPVSGAWNATGGGEMHERKKAWGRSLERRRTEVANLEDIYLSKPESSSGDKTQLIKKKTLTGPAIP